MFRSQVRDILPTCQTCFFSNVRIIFSFFKDVLYTCQGCLQITFFGHVKDILTIAHVRDVISCLCVSLCVFVVWSSKIAQKNVILDVSEKHPWDDKKKIVSELSDPWAVRSLSCRPRRQLRDDKRPWAVFQPLWCIDFFYFILFFFLCEGGGGWMEMGEK